MSGRKTTLLNLFPNKQHSHSHQSGNYIKYTFRSYQISTVELRHEMEIKQHKNPSIDIKSSTNIKFIVFILKVIVYGCVL
jgi:hypothetical protein